MKNLTAAIVACTVALNLLSAPAARAGDNFVLPVGVGEGTFKIGEDGNPTGFTFEAEGSATSLGAWTNYGETFIVGDDEDNPGNLKVIGVVTFESALLDRPKSTLVEDTTVPAASSVSYCGQAHRRRLGPVSVSSGGGSDRCAQPALQGE